MSLCKYHHIDAPIHNKDMFARELVRQKKMVIKYIKSSENLADFFTKILPVSTFRTMRDRIMNIT